MYGYVRPDRSVLSGLDQQRFRAAYCGLCETLRRRYGLPARFAVNFDFTFLAMVLSRGGCSEWRRCPAHPFHKRPCVCESEAMDAAADYTVILAWWKLKDSVRDEGFFRSLPSRLALLLLRRAYRTASKIRTEFSENTRRCLEELSRLEDSKTGSMDAAADCFARLLSFAAECGDGEDRRIRREIFYHTGRCVYLLDAADDLEKDMQNGSYNPLLLRFSCEGGKLSEEDTEQLRSTIRLSQHRAAAALALRPPDVWQPILENIVSDGLTLVTDMVLAGTWQRRKKTKEERYPDILKQGEEIR